METTPQTSSLPADSIIEYTLAKMQHRLSERTDVQTGLERSGLLFMGNVHDAYPRALLLDTRLSPLDKIAWMMIRQYAMQNDGAIFPSYDDLQQLLASPGMGKASRHTVSRALTMLRLTGWLSLCKKVRDAQGRVRGNIYAQHDEPLSARDAETFDPGWLDMVGEACRHKTQAVSDTAWQVLTAIQDDPMMRHRHSCVAMIAERLTRLSTPAQVAAFQAGAEQAGAESALSELRPAQPPKTPSADSALSHRSGAILPSANSALRGIPRAGDPVQNLHHNNVRSFTQSVNKKTYVTPQSNKNPIPALPDGFVWPDGLQDILPENEQPMLAQQLHQLAQQSPALVQQVVTTLLDGVRQKRVNNPVAYLLTTLKQARAGQFRVEPMPLNKPPASRTAVKPAAERGMASPQRQLPPPPRSGDASPEKVHAMVAQLRATLAGHCQA